MNGGEVLRGNFVLRLVCIWGLFGVLQQSVGGGFDEEENGETEHSEEES